MQTTSEKMAGDATAFLLRVRSESSGSGNGGWKPAACVEQGHFEDALAFLEHLRPAHWRWGKEAECDWVFRGQSNAAWPLLPSLCRDEGIEKLWPLVVRFREGARQHQGPSSTLAIERSHFVMALDAAEREAVRQFAELADELGLYAPDEVDWAEGGAAFLDNPARSLYPSSWVAYAQHHGVPTQMLDWTRKPLHAAFFAVDQAEKSKADRLAVWAIRRSVCRSHGHILNEFTCGRWQHTFLHAQDGLFVYRAQGAREFVQTGHWLPFDHVVAQEWEAKDDTPVIRLFTLPVAKAPELRRLLWRERVSRAHLMPGYSTVADALVNKWTWA